MKKLISKMICAAVLCGAFFMGTAFSAYAEESEPPSSKAPKQTEKTEVTTEVDIDNVDELLDYIENEVNSKDTETSGKKSNSEPEPEATSDGKIEFTIPKGNGTVIDQQVVADYLNNTVLQLLTVQSRGGHTFYIIVENNGDAQNVYFLNAVDDWDLLAFSEEFPEDFLQVIEAERRRNLEAYQQALETQGMESPDTEPNANPPLVKPDKPSEEPDEPGAASPNNSITILFIVIGVAACVFIFIKKKNGGGNKGGGKKPKNTRQDEEEDEYEDEEE